MKSSKQAKRGIIYAAFGYEYLIMAAYSAKTAKKTNPGIICEVVTNIPFDNQKAGNYSPFDNVKIIDYESSLNRTVKTNIIKYASFDIGAYIDCDTEIRGSLDPIFNCLERFDVAIKINSNPTIKNFEIAPGIHGRFFPVWNGGVIFFRKNNQSKSMFRRWSKIFEQEKKSSDQPALARAIYDTKDLNVLSLNAIWNTDLGEQVIVLKNKTLERKSLIKWLQVSMIWHYRKPNKWPYVAPEIYNAHQHLYNSIINPTGSVLAEIDYVSRKYKIFSSRLYLYISNRPLLKRIYKIILKILVRLKIVQKIELKREKYSIGKPYERAKITEL